MVNPEQDESSKRPPKIDHRSAEEAEEEVAAAFVDELFRMDATLLLEPKET